MFLQSVVFVLRVGFVAIGLYQLPQMHVLVVFEDIRLLLVVQEGDPTLNSYQFYDVKVVLTVSLPFEQVEWEQRDQLL